MKPNGFARPVIRLRTLLVRRPNSAVLSLEQRIRSRLSPAKAGKSGVQRYVGNVAEEL